MSILLFAVSFVVIILLLRRHPDFSFFGLYIIANWLAMSLSVAVAEQLDSFFPELNVRAADTFAAVFLNVYIAWFLYCAIRIYRWISQYEIVSATPSFNTIHDVTGRRNYEYCVFGVLITVMLAIAAFAFVDKGVALGQGTSVSGYLQQLTVLERLPFTVLIIALPALSARFKECLTSSRYKEAWLWGMLTISPAAIWIVAGEKFGYLVMMCSYAVYPWRDRMSLDKFFVLFLACMFIALPFSAYYYSTMGFDPLEMLQLRFVIQGQLWWYFAQEPNTFNPASMGAIQFMASGQDTMRYLMSLSMPYRIVCEYDRGGAVLSGGFFPAILHGYGWIGGLVSIPFYAACFAVGIWITRSAVQIGNPFISFLLMGVFVYPGIEIYVVGNLNRLLFFPPTFWAFAGMLLIFAYGGLVQVRRTGSIRRRRQFVGACAAS